MPVIRVQCKGCERDLTLHLVPYADLWGMNVSKVLINKGTPEGYEYSDESVKKHPAYFCPPCWETLE